MLNSWLFRLRNFRVACQTINKASQPAIQPKCSINYILIYAYFRFFVLTLLLNLLIITLAALVWLFYCMLLHILRLCSPTNNACNGWNCVKHWFEAHDGVFFFDSAVFILFYQAVFFTFKQNTTGSCCIHLRPVLYFFFVLTSYHTELEVHSMSTICNYI